MKLNRREFLGRTSVTGVALACGGSKLATALAAQTPPNLAARSLGRPALLGGQPVRTRPFPGWPVFDATEERALLEVLRTGKWFRGYGEMVDRFERAYAELTGAKYCVATASGTAALTTSLGALDIGPGDEVILPPFTFIATYNVVVLNYALPVFVDMDVKTFQLDANKLDAAITPRTRAILPVHLGGAPADMDKIMEIANRHKVPVIEDACQSHLAEWRGKKVGTLGLAGCFSFQASKNLNSGEGGAILTNDEAFAEQCYSFHNQGRIRKPGAWKPEYSASRGSNLRLTEFQAGLLMAQMTRLEAQARTRADNGRYLTRALRAAVPGVVPAEEHEGCTFNAYHLYMARYLKEHFAGMDKAKFLKAIDAEGIPFRSGYSPMNRDAHVRALLKNRHYRRIYPPEVLDTWEERNQCPQNDLLCSQAIWFSQNILLGTHEDMDQIVEALVKIQKHAAELAKA
ncbi:MAG: DegT/DnrJ/EryC1/StrS family aminotransferase [Verrucomicrobiae bacterium]|nr:DegT/DnrJ/EryC1/StrS family aminotransferase [Verrucomicrobiae bacterium]